MPSPGLIRSIDCIDKSLMQLSKERHIRTNNTAVRSFTGLTQNKGLAASSQKALLSHCCFPLLKPVHEDEQRNRFQIQPARYRVARSAV
jgi:hypothetical protein